MTATVTDATVSALLTSAYDVISTTVGFVVVIVLAVLLVQREVTRLLARERSIRSGWAFDIAIVPLLLAFAVVVSLRLVELVV